VAHIYAVVAIAAVGSASAVGFGAALIQLRRYSIKPPVRSNSVGTKVSEGSSPCWRRVCVSSEPIEFVQSDANWRSRSTPKA
jgi:hypothetical protein